MSKATAWIAVLASVLALVLAAAPASGARGIAFGLQDDAWLLGGEGTLDSRLDALTALGVDTVRITARWDAVARRQPVRPRDPNDSAYDWALYDAVLAGLQSRGIVPLVTLYGTPRWANGGGGPSRVPRSPAAMRNFAQAAASRWPFVRRWLVWNEPNQRKWLRPTDPAVYVKRLLNPAHAGIRAANPKAKVGGGVTAPRGGRRGVSPVAWIRGMDRAGARLDAVAHHPYPLSRGETPRSGGCARCETITMATIERLLRETRRAFPRARVWLTEYGYQTRPPDPLLGVSPALQARYLGEAAYAAWQAARVDLLIWFLYRDEPRVDRWQSGLTTLQGRPKPALAAFALPLAQVVRVRSTTIVWGQVRPGAGSRPFRLQVRRAGNWRWAGPPRATDAHGVFRARVRAGKGSSIRIWSPADGRFSPPLRIR